jgi:fibronectin-binding autotransporter adhesin
MKKFSATKVRSILCSAACFAAGCSAVPALAADLFVPTALYPTIQDAINAAVAGDAVIIAPGTYLERIDFLNKPISVRSSAGAATTIIDGSLSGTVVTIINSTNAELAGLTIRGGDLVTGSGSGVLITGSTVAIRDCIIADNIANDGAGAGVFAQSSALTIERTAFNANQAVSLITGTGLGTGLSLLDSAATITNSTFDGNLAVEHGGGAIGASGASTVTIIGGSFTNNRATAAETSTTTFGGGGAIAARGGAVVSVSGAAFSANTANRGGGGGIFLFDTVPAASLTVTNCTFTANISSNVSGGAISTDSEGAFSVTDSVFENNRSAGASGGAIGIFAFAPAGVEGAIIAGSTFRGNVAPIGGAIDTSARTTIRDSLFESNEAVGGQSGSFVLVGGGGAIRTNSGVNFTVVERSIFRQNRVDAGSSTSNAGGAIRARRSNMRIVGSTFDQNSTVENRGGAIALESTSSIARTVQIIDTSFTANTTSGVQFQEGGAITVTGNIALSITDGVFSNNTASTAGGHIWAETGASLTIDGTSFVGGGSRDFGGVRFPATIAPNAVSISNTTFRNLTATPNTLGQGGDVGALFVSGANVSIRDVVIENCRAKNVGGIRTNGISTTSAITVENVLIANCAATSFDAGGSNGGEFGGGEIAGGNTIVRNVTVRDCAAKIYAGLRVTGNTSALIENSRFTNNVATPTPTFGSGDVGALHLTSPNATGRGLRFENNRSKIAGALLGNSSGTFLLEDSVFINNRAIPTPSDSFGDGGGARIDAVSTTIRRTRFEANSGRTGGGLNLVGGGATGTASLTDVTFIGNQAIANTTSNSSARGGGAYIERAGVTTLTNVRFDGNSARRGGGLWTNGVGLSAINLLAVRNSATDLGGGIFVGPGFPLSSGAVGFINATIADNTGAGGLTTDQCNPAGSSLVNSIVRGNTGAGGAAQNIRVQSCSGTTSLRITWSNIEGGAIGAGNVDGDPRFTAPASGDYSLGAGSVSIDSGNNAGVPGGVNTDLSGAARFFDDPGTPDTGLGTAPIVDQGAFENQGTRCQADFNNDGTADFFDYLDFVAAFDAEDPSADFNNDGTVDFFDYLDFVAAFDIGCR